MAVFRQFHERIKGPNLPSILEETCVFEKYLGILHEFLQEKVHSKIEAQVKSQFFSKTSCI